MLTLAQARKQRRELNRDNAREQRKAAAAALHDLREKLSDARAERNAALREAAGTCRTERLALRERAHARRKATLAALRETYAKERTEARDVCLVRKAEVLVTARDPIDRARGKWEAERKYQDDLRRIQRGNRERHHGARRAHAAERRSESDDAVVANILPEHRPLWDRVKHTIKGNERESRSESFLRYAESHPDELLEAMGDESDRAVEALIAQREQAERALRPPPQRRRRYTPAELASVPF